MIKPVVQDGAFVADVLAARREGGHLHLWWLGQSGFLLQWAGHHLCWTRIYPIRLPASMRVQTSRMCG